MLAIRYVVYISTKKKETVGTLLADRCLTTSEKTENIVRVKPISMRFQLDIKQMESI